MGINYKNKETGEVENLEMIKFNFNELKANTNEFNNLEFDDFLNQFYEDIELKKTNEFFKNLEKDYNDYFKKFFLLDNSIGYLKKYLIILENEKKILINENSSFLIDKKVVINQLKIQDINECINYLNYIKSKTYEIKENGN